MLLLVTLVFTACSRKKKEVASPTNLTIENDVLSWDAVPGTLTYDVKIDDTVYSTQETSFALPITDYDFHEITVRANTHDGTSEYATPLTYARRAAQTVLPALSSPVLSMTSNRVMWSTVLNNNGYLIYMGDSVFTAEKNTTYYDLSFPGDGIYYIRMQTLGDGVTYSNSKISNAYAVTVKNGKAPLQKLPKTDFTFDAATKSLVWTNRYSAAAVSFEIYQDNISQPIETIPADATKTKMSYKPTLNGGRVGYTMRLISNNGLYNPSDFNDGITFPIADEAPATLSIRADSDLGVYLLEWDAVVYCDGYTLEIDGEDIDAGTALSMAVPEGLAAGRHIARVKTKGLGITYADSFYGEGIVFYVNERGKVTTPLTTPSAPAFSQPEEGTLSVVSGEINGATRYRFLFEGASGQNVLVSEFATFDISDGRLGTRRATDEENVVIGRILADLPTGICASVVAVPSDPLYVESAVSEQRYFTTGEFADYAAAPDLRFVSGHFEWTNSAEDVAYEILVDGVLTDLGEEGALAEGVHRARLRVKAENALWSKEILFRTPVDLEPPTDLTLNGNVLSFVGSTNATGYLLYVNGKTIATISLRDSKINLGNYLTTDGEYVLHLVATASASVFLDSAPSRQILYVKNDAAYGTEVKPFLPTSAAELWSEMRRSSSAYFRLTAGGVYDFTDYDFSASDAFIFRGTLMGNGATLKGIRVGSPLFAALEGATIRDLRIEIEGSAFGTSQSALFAKKITDSTFSSVTLYLSGRATVTSDVAFGALCYEATGLTMRDSAVACELNLEDTRNVEFAVVADKFDGTLFNLTLSGRVTLGGRDVRCGLLSVSGELSLSGLESTLSLTVNATGNSTVGGVSLGTVTGDRVNPQTSVSLNAAFPYYYGVAEEGVTLSDSNIGGSASVQGSTVTLCGIAKDGALSLSDVKVSALLKGKATDTLEAVGIASEIGEDSVTATLSFEGEIDANAPTVNAAGIAATSLGAHAAHSAGKIAVTGKNARVAAGVLEADALTLDSAASVVLTKVSDATVGGAALTASGKVTLSGTLSLSATECGEVECGGAVATGNQVIEIGSYAVSGTLSADTVRFGGVSYDAKTLELKMTDLTVNVTVTSDDLKAAGGTLSASDLTLSEPSTLSVTLTGVGSGEISGFGGQIGGNDFSDLALSGRLSLTGSGSLCGVAQSVGNVRNVTSSVSLVAEGDAEVCGFFRSVSSASDLTLSDVSIDLRSNAGKYYGITGYLMNGTLSDVTMSRVTFRAEPLLATDSSMLFCGLTDDVKVLENISVTDVTYTFGEYATLSFYGLAEQLSERMNGTSLSYILRSDAAESSIGGAFSQAKGTLSASLGTSTAPLTIETTGRAYIGGLALESDDLTLTDLSAKVALSVTLPAESDGEAGGLFREIQGAHTVTCSSSSAEISLTRKGEGSLVFGGIAANCNGTLRGAKATLDVTGGKADDLYGGVIGTLVAGRLGNCAAYGSVTTAGTVGGLVGVASYGFLNGGATAMKITSQGTAGGLLARATGCVANNVCSISRLTEKGAGLFAEGENLSFANGYFAGSAAEYALAGRAVNCALSFFLLDVTMSSASVPVVGEGSVDYSSASLAYGYTGDDLGDAFRADGKRYPYVREIGAFPENTSVASRSLPAINITESVDLYDVLPRFYDAATPTITWVDTSGLLTIEDGVATVVDNGSGTLYGILSGGVRVYTVFYTASGFVPLAGLGTAESPYLIRDLKYLRYLKTYSEEFPTAHFRLDLEEDTVEGAAFTLLFTESDPFRGTIDFGGVLFLSPVLPEEGILGYLDGATVKGLSLGGELSGTLLAAVARNATITEVNITDASFAGECLLIGSMTDSRLEDVTLVGRTMSEMDFRLVDDLAGSTLEDVSVSLSFNTGYDVSACLVNEATASALTRVQLLISSSIAAAVDLCLLREDVGSTCSSCMVLIDVASADSEESRIAGLAFSAEGTTFLNGAVILRAEFEVTPLVAEGTATYTDMILLAETSDPAPAGVTLATTQNARTMIGALTDYVEGDLPTPLGFALFGEENSADFTLSKSEVTVSDRVSIESLFSINGEKPFATLVSYSFTGDCAAVEGEFLRPGSDGTGTLTVTNLYGVSSTVTVIVEGFAGFSTGSGTEVDPYLISDNISFLRMLEKEDTSVYYRLTSDLTDVVIAESATFKGVLTSDGHTVEITLTADSFLEEGRGRIEGVNFVLTKDALEASSLGGIFAKSLSSLKLVDAEITINCPSVTLADDTTFGLLVGSAESSTLFEDVTLSVGTVEITAGEGATVGLLCGSAEESRFLNVTVSGVVTLTAEGEVFFGAVGILTANAETTLLYDEETDSESVAYYVEGVSLDLTLTAVGGDLTMGGFAGRSAVTVAGISGTVALTFTGGTATVGGAVGLSYSDVKDVTLDCLVATSSEVLGGYVGGIVGQTSKSVVGGTVNAVISVVAAGELYVGGAIGDGGGDLENMCVTADVTARSLGTEAQVESLRDPESDYVILLAVGGAVGRLYGDASRVFVTVTRVSAQSDYVQTDLWVLAGSIGGRLSYAEDVEVKGTGTVSATGGRAVSAGIAPMIGDGVDRAVISGVTVAGDDRYGALGIFYREDGWVTDLFVALSGLAEDVPALIGTMSEGTTMEHARYLSGKAVGTGESESMTDVAKLTSLAAFNATTLYDAFDGEIWIIAGDSIPSLR